MTDEREPAAVILPEGDDNPPSAPPRRNDRWEIVVHGAVAMLVAGPLLSGGYLLLLDFPYGPNVVVRWASNPNAPSPVNQAPLQALLWLVGRAGPFAAFVVIFTIVFAIGFGMNRAIKALLPSTTPAGRVVGGILYSVNPFTFVRLAHGHIGLLAGMAMLPILALAITRLHTRPTIPRAVVFGLAIAGIGFVSIHATAMLLFVLPALLLMARLWNPRLLAVSGVVAVAASSWWLAQVVIDPPPSFGPADLAAFATVPDGITSAGHVTALYGFWRTGEFALPRDGVPAWPLTFAPIAAAVLAGWLILWKRDRRASIVLGATLIVAVVLAAGTSFPPTAGIFRFLFESVPGFGLFREPQKWVAAVVFVYAMLSAAAVDALAQRWSSPDRRMELIAICSVLIAAIAFYGRSIVWNSSVLRPVAFPPDWDDAGRELTARPGRALVLPWHQYLTFGFSSVRIANPAETYFDVPVLMSDNPEVGRLSSHSQSPDRRAVERVLFEPGGRELLSRTLADLCTRWVILYKTADWESYAWLDEQPTLTRAFDGPTIRLYRAAIPRCT